jgi:hypothetical protein
MAGGRAPRAKGGRAERALVHVLQENGFAAERVPLSGATRSRFVGDLSVPLLGVDRRIKVKVRGDCLRQIYKRLDGAHCLIVKADRRTPPLCYRFGSPWRSHVSPRGALMNINQICAASCAQQKFRPEPECRQNPANNVKETGRWITKKTSNSCQPYVEMNRVTGLTNSTIGLAVSDQSKSS